MTAAQSGFDVLVHHRDSPDEAESVAVQVRGLDRQAATVAADLNCPSDIANLIAAAPGPVRLLVNCASLFTDDRIGSLSVEGWDAIIATNLRAPILLAQAFAAALSPDDQGLIVNVTDQRVWRLTPQFFSYTISKAALWTATQTLAQSLAPNIRVNAIGPGPVLASIHQTAADFATEAGGIPLGRGPQPHEIADALRYLIDATSVTGQMIAVDGGQHLSWRTPDVVNL